MTSTSDDNPQPWEERLLSELRELGKVADPVPAEVAFAATGSFALRRVDADLAELTFDSLLDGASVAAVRSEDTTRLVTFEAGDVSVEVEIVEAGDRRRMVGQVVPPQAAHVEVRTASGSSAVDTDDLGRFAVEGLPPGPASLRCRLPASTRVIETGWVVL
jgi:hypothetical protein